MQKRKFNKIIRSIPKIQKLVRKFLCVLRMKKAKIRVAKLQAFVKMRIQMRKFIIMREQNAQYQQRKRIEAAKRKILM